MLEISTIYFYTDKESIFQKTSVWSPPAGSLGCWNHATPCVSLHDTGLHYKKFLPLTWILNVGKKQISQDGGGQALSPHSLSLLPHVL